MRTIQINGNTYKIAYNLRSQFTYEEIAGQPYDGKKLVDNYMLLYAMLLANNEDFSLEFSELVDACDEDPIIFRTFCGEIEDYAKKMSAFITDKKKVSR